ncbi:MAG: ABC transporter substrate-binding protein [Clostridiales bacterium]|nr:ABC transporter substrate-binding protein [Clostridiales bacterium]
MKQYRTIILTIIAVMSVTLLTGCTTFDNFKKAFIDKPEDKSATIEIGVFEPTTGVDSEAAKAEIKGIELAHDKYPNVNGKIVELIYGDNASDIYAAETAIKDLIAKKPAVILGSYGSVYSMVAGDYILDAKIPTIAITNTNPLVTKNNKYYFRVCYVDSNQGDLLARYVLEEKKETTAGVLLPKEDDAAMAMATAFTDRMKVETENEDAITVYENYKAGAGDFTKQLKAVQASGVKSVLLPGAIDDAAAIIKQAKKMKLDVTFLGDTQWSTEDFRSLVGSDANEKNTAFISFVSADAKENAENENTAGFIEAYYDKYGSGSEPEDATALGYDAYTIALNAIEKAGADKNGNAIRKVLDGEYSFEGVSGKINFNNMGDPIKTAYISTWKNNIMISIYTIEPTL